MLNLYYELYHYNTEHRLIEKQGPIQSRSFLKQFLDALYCSSSHVNATTTDITNASRTLGSSNTFGVFLCRHPGLDAKMRNNIAGSSTMGGIAADGIGIVVGTASTTVNPVDYKLQTLVSHGTGSGQLEYYGCWASKYTVNSGSAYASFDLERIWHNGSGGSIVLHEIGIYFVSPQTADPPNSLCGVRDVLGTASGTTSVTVLNGEYLKVKYTMKITV
jgi:hypothetical protein